MVVNFDFLDGWLPVADKYKFNNSIYGKNIVLDVLK
jgi:hypothetical protein